MANGRKKSGTREKTKSAPPREPALRKTSRPKSPAAKLTGDRVHYLYGISKGAEFAPRVVGIDGESALKSVSASGLTAWYSAVAADEFGEGLASKMDDLEWLAATSVRHQRAVAAIAEHATIVPARFATVFTSIDSLKRHVAQHRSATLAALKRIDGAEEWGIKVFRRAAGGVASAPAATSAASGREYLQKKASLQRRPSGAGLDEDVIEFAEALGAVAQEAAPAGKLSSTQRDLEWQATFLVKRTSKPQWETVLRKYASQWSDSREIECSGPWPPYSFVSAQ